MPNPNIDLSKQCLACDSKRLTSVLDLGQQPLANAYTTVPSEVHTTNLIVLYCEDCTHCQLVETVAPEVLFSEYKYVSGTTETLRKHFKELVAETGYYLKPMRDTPYASNYTHPAPSTVHVLDIGCNDGSLMEQYLRKGYRVEGVDPALNLRGVSLKKGLNVHVEFWNSQTALAHTEYDVITVLNCLAHNGDPYDFLLGCTRVLAPGGIIIVEFPYFPDTLKNNDIGQFYAEHHSYFSARSFMALIDRLQLYVNNDIYHFPSIHGGTVRFVLRRGLQPHRVAFRKLVLQESIKEDLQTYQKRLKDQLKRLGYLLGKVKKGGSKIIAYGASAKSSTLFNMPEMVFARSLVDYVVDDNPFKQGMYCPGSGLLIKRPEDILEETEPVVILITVHNFKAEVLSRLKLMGAKCDIINYTPEVCLE